jgi:pilus assembly protein CpaF
MRLAKRLGRPGMGAPTGAADSAAPARVVASEAARRDMASIAAKMHQEILDRLDLGTVAQLSADELRKRLQQIINQLVVRDQLALSAAESAELAEQVLDELTGLGPLEHLIKDPSVSDVLVNGFDRVYVESDGRLQLTDVRFRDDRHLIHTIQRMVARVGRRIDESSPMVDARLPDGSRVNAIIPPLALDGPTLSIRRFGDKQLSGPRLVRQGAMSERMLAYLRVAVRSRCSILISGGTGAGKTTLLNMLAGFISKRERIITIEDAAELRLPQPHVVRLESRPPNFEGKGEVTIRELMKNALRMRPDRIVVGEVRGAEVLDMLQAMNTGHEGSMATIHANSAKDSMTRLMTMLGMTGSNLAESTVASMISRAIHVVVQLARMQDGRRRITEISEVLGLADNEVMMHPVFHFEQTGVEADGGIIGRHVQQNDTLLRERFRLAGAQEGAAAGEIGQ